MNYFNIERDWNSYNIWRKEKQTEIYTYIEKNGILHLVCGPISPMNILFELFLIFFLFFIISKCLLKQVICNFIAIQSFILSCHFRIWNGALLLIYFFCFLCKPEHKPSDAKILNIYFCFRRIGRFFSRNIFIIFYFIINYWLGTIERAVNVL